MREYASKRLGGNAAAIKMAARALAHAEGLRTWVWRWRRLVKAKKAGKAAVGLALPGVGLVTWTILAVINWTVF
jgi:hypothetical protein